MDVYQRATHTHTSENMDPLLDIVTLLFTVIEKEFSISFLFFLCSEEFSIFIGTGNVYSHAASTGLFFFQN